MRVAPHPHLVAMGRPHTTEPGFRKGVSAANKGSVYSVEVLTAVGQRRRSAVQAQQHRDATERFQAAMGIIPATAEVVALTWNALDMPA